MKKYLALAAALLLILALTRFRRFLLVDSCLDRGGRWDYNTGTCEEVRR